MADPDPKPAKPAAKPKAPAAGTPAATPPPPTTIPGVVWLREWTTTAIAGIVVVVTMVILAWTFTGATTFQEHKDILTLALPILGSIIGYYFGRVPAERRAEAAEGKLDDAQANAKSANATASQAQQQAADKDRKLDLAKKGLKQVQKTTAGAGGRPAGAPAPEGADAGAGAAEAAKQAHTVASTILDHLDG